jgi:tetratricopeptide (TPR) repeat protein
MSILQRYQEALDACNRAIQLDDTCASAYCQKGEILHQVRRLQEALDALEQAISLEPDARTPYKQKASLLADVRRYDEALAAYDQAIRLDAYDVFLCKDKAELLVQVGRDEDALVVFDQFIERTPESFEGYTWKLHFLAEHKRYADGLATCEQAIALHPHWAQPHHRRGDMLWYMERYEQALAAYNKALELEPTHFSLLVDRAGVLKKLLRYEEANAEYQRAELSAPRPWYAVICLFGKVDLKQVAEAKARLEAAGKELSDEAIQAEIHLMHEEKRAAELKASALFGPMCLLTQEKQEWSGTPKQFKELICSRFPEEFAMWYRAPYKYVDELKKIAPELGVEGIVVGVPPESALVTLTRTAMEKQQSRSEGATPDTTNEGK